MYPYINGYTRIDVTHPTSIYATWLYILYLTVVWKAPARCPALSLTTSIWKSSCKWMGEVRQAEHTTKLQKLPWSGWLFHAEPSSYALRIPPSQPCVNKSPQFMMTATNYSLKTHPPQKKNTKIELPQILLFPFWFFFPLISPSTPTPIPKLHIPKPWRYTHHRKYNPYVEQPQ